MINVHVIKSRWLRGDSQDSWLLHPTSGKMCCVGFLARKLGNKPSAVRGIRTLDGYPRCELNEKTQDFHHEYSDLLDQAYDTNDDHELDDKQRMKALKAIGKDMGVNFIFANKRRVKR